MLRRSLVHLNSKENEYRLLVGDLYRQTMAGECVCCQTKIYKEWSSICLKETNNYARLRV